jgi:hypothetical protein
MKNILSKSIIAFLFVWYAGSVSASTTATVSSFQMMKSIFQPNTSSIPKVIEFPITASESKQSPAIYDTASGQFSSIYIKDFAESLPVQVQAGEQSLPVLHDNNYATSYNFETDGTETTTILTYDAGRAITSTQLWINLDPNVKRPISVSLSTKDSPRTILVVADQPLPGSILLFPETTARVWEIKIVHKQPLRIQEISIIPSYGSTPTSYSVRFLAQPGRSYQLYLKPNAGVVMPIVPYVDLQVDPTEVIYIATPPTVYNPDYKTGDMDNDKVPDDQDNCPDTANPDQKDINTNNKGDACEDFDHDTVINALDNCPEKPNIDQHNSDSDAYGDVCDPEESRITERYGWLPWLGILIGFASVALVFKITTKHGGNRNT